MIATTPHPKAAIPAGILFAMAAWGAGVALASASGALGALVGETMPAFAVLVALGIAVPTTLYFNVNPVRRAVDRGGLGNSDGPITGFPA